MKVWDMGYAAVGWDLGWEWEWDCWTGAGVGWARALLFFILNHILTQNGIVVKIFCIACMPSPRRWQKMASARSGQLTGTAKGMAGGRAHTSQKKFFLLDF
jgi:hypothetical protein